MRNLIRRSRLWWLIPCVALVLSLGWVAEHTTARATGEPTSCSGQQFTDVCPGDWYYPYVTDLVSRGAITGYGDNTFRPGNMITRGQIVKVIVIASGLSAAIPGSPTFADVLTSSPFFNWVEIAAAHNTVSGYQCGGAGEPCDGQQHPYFRPNQAVNRGQIAKMLVQARGWTPPTPGSQTFRDVPATSPYFIFVEYVAGRGIISGYTCGGGGEPCPGSYFRPGFSTTRSQASKMISVAVSGPPTPGPTSTSGPSSTPVPLPTGTVYWAPPPSIPCAVFPADNIWNRNISSLPVHSRSASYISNIGTGSILHPDFGSGTWQGQHIGFPYNVMPAGQPQVPIQFTQYPQQSDPGPYPVPTNATIEGGPTASGDRHVIVVDQSTCLAYELYRAQPNADSSWQAGSGARWNLTSNALRPVGWTSADAAGLPILPGMVRYDEVAAGAIHHAIRFTTVQINQGYVWPARHSDGRSSDVNVLPMGSRLRLKASVNISSYPAQVQVILQALKDYGMILADTGDPLNISGTPDPRWDDHGLLTMEGLHASDFEVVDEASLMIDPNSGQSR